MAGISTASSSVVTAQPELSIHDGVVTTTSIQVAHFFGKRHDSVMRALAREMADPDYKNGKGGAQTSKSYRMTRDGFMPLAMGFSGKEALHWKLAYIAARIQLAHSLAAQAAAQVTQTVFDAIASGRDSDWRRVRYLLSFGYDREGQPTIPQAQVVGDDQMVTSLNALIQHITKHDVIPPRRATGRAGHRLRPATLRTRPGARTARRYRCQSRAQQARHVADDICELIATSPSGIRDRGCFSLNFQI